MIYVTTSATVRKHQVNFDDLFSDKTSSDWGTRGKPSDTVTKVYDRLPSKLRTTPISRYILMLHDFNAKYYDKTLAQIKQFEALSPKDRYKVKDTSSKIAELYGEYAAAEDEIREAEIMKQIEMLENEMETSPEYAYRTFDLRKKSAPAGVPTYKLPKKHRRTINAPNHELYNVLAELKLLLEYIMPENYHTSAYAYVKGRCTVDAIKKHQQWDSHWFAKFDFSNFFGSTTLPWLIKQLETIYPFSTIMMTEFRRGNTVYNGREELIKALELCFLDGGLPQGTPISPLITNIMMIPFDHIVSNKLGKDMDERFCYTRYADDIHISCHVSFNVKEIEKYIIDVLHDLEAPFSLNTAKTHYGSRAGGNWNLGLMLNKDNKITVGSENKRMLKADLNNFYLDHKNGLDWELSKVYQLQGKLSYYKSIETEVINMIIAGFNKKYHTDIEKLIKSKIKQI